MVQLLSASHNRMEHENYVRKYSASAGSRFSKFFRRKTSDTGARQSHSFDDLICVMRDWRRYCIRSLTRVQQGKNMLRILALTLFLTFLSILAGCQEGSQKSSGPQRAKSAENRPEPTTAELAMLRDAAIGDTAAVKGWLEKGVDVNMRGDSLNTPIMEAAFAGHLETVKLLLDHGADLSAKKIDGETPVSLAARHQDIVELFKNVLALTDAASKGDNKAVTQLIEKGTPVNGLNQFGQSPLTEASWNGRTETVKLLLGKGADPNIKKPDGQGPLSIAMAQKHQDIVALLNAANAKQSKETRMPASK